MKSLLTFIILLHSTYLLMTLQYFYSHDVKPQKTLLTLSGDLNQCLSQNKGPCCDIYNQLIDEAMFYGISVDNSLTCK